MPPYGEVRQSQILDLYYEHKKHNSMILAKSLIDKEIFISNYITSNFKEEGAST